MTARDASGMITAVEKQDRFVVTQRRSRWHLGSGRITRWWQVYDREDQRQPVSEYTSHVKARKDAALRNQLEARS